MKRIVALDVGSKTIGVAISDPLQIIANSLDTIRFDENNFSNGINKLKTLLYDYKDIECIVVGYPKNMNNTKSKTTLLVDEFINLLKSKTTYKVVIQDERKTTSYAENALKEMNINSKKIKGISDKQSANIILQMYLEKVR